MAVLITDEDDRRIVRREILEAGVGSFFLAILFASLIMLITLLEG